MIERFLKIGVGTTLITVLFTSILSFNTLFPLPGETVASANGLQAAQPQEPGPDSVPAVEEPVEEAPVSGWEEETPGENPTPPGGSGEESPSPDDPLLPPEETERPDKVAYLTFDDGPSPNITPQILDILQAYEIKASFFVLGSLAEKYPELILRIHSEGHHISNHTYSHNYKKVYASVQAFLAELERTDQILEDILGDQFTSRWIRFPGGSFGDKRKVFREAAAAAGYTNIDWNVLNGDAEADHVSAERQLARLKETLHGQKQAVILMHDSSSKKTTAEALPSMIEYLLAKGYVFGTLETYQEAETN